MLSHIARTKRGSLLFGLLVGVSLISIASPSYAAHKHVSQGPHLKELEAQLQALSAKVAQQDATISGQQQAITALQNRVQSEAFLLSAPESSAAEMAPPPPATMVPASILPSTDGVHLAEATRPTNAPSTALSATAPATGASSGAASPIATSAPTSLATASGVSSGTPSSAPQAAPSAPSPNHPVGEAPASAHQIQEVAALPESAGVLTPAGHWVVEPSLQFVVSTANRLVFQGVEIVPGIQLGVIDANNADHDTGVASASFRYGITNRLEAEVAIPFVDRQDRVTTLAQRDETVNETENLKGASIGDIDVSARYQINNVEPGEPIFIADAHIKPPTGRSPYDVNYDQYGVATSLATGSGFWGTEAGLTMLYPSDPAVIFGGVNYTHNFSRDINKTIGGAYVGKVTPGDSIGASMGFGLSLNQRLSVSLGYSHIYIFQTTSQIGGTLQKANSLQVGSLLMGWSFRLNDRTSLNTNFQFGVTSDAPNMQATISLPMKF